MPKSHLPKMKVVALTNCESCRSEISEVCGKCGACEYCHKTLTKSEFIQWLKRYKHAHHYQNDEYIIPLNQRFFLMVSRQHFAGTILWGLNVHVFDHTNGVGTKVSNTIRGCPEVPLEFSNMIEAMVKEIPESFFNKIA